MHQSSSLRVASANLDSHVLALSEVFENFEALTRRELDKQNELLRYHSLDMDIISQVKIHPEFLSGNARRGSDAPGKARSLGDYISNAKMQVVADSCSKLHESLQSRFRDASEAMIALTTGADEVRQSTDTSFVQDAQVCADRAKQALDRTVEAIKSLDDPTVSRVEVLIEIRKIDYELREDVHLICAIKNRSIEHTLLTLRHISQLQSDLSEIPSSLTSLESDLRNKAGFMHLQRLHRMLYMYGATLVEVVRRKEFGRFFAERAQTIAEVMAKLSTSERKRRQAYRGEVHGQLPFEARGMDEPTPSLEISTTGGADSIFSLGRQDVQAFLNLIDHIEKSTPLPFAAASPTPESEPPMHPAAEVRLAMERLIGKMDNLQGDFDKLAERSILSASRLAQSKRRTNSDASAYQETVDQLRETQRAKAELEDALLRERESLQAEVDLLRQQSAETSTRLARTIQLEADLESVQIQLDHSTAARQALDEQHTRTLAELESQKEVLGTALSEATKHTREVETLRLELAHAKEENAALARLHEESAERIHGLLNEQATTLQELDTAKISGKDLESRIRIARQEGEEANRALKDALKERDRLLRAQATQADRLLRDHIAEADGDRAVLEHHFIEMKATLAAREGELKEAHMELDVARADVAGLREELQRVNYEVTQSHSELRDVQTKLADTKIRIAQADRQLLEALKIATAFRDTSARAQATAQHLTLSSSKTGRQHLAESALSPGGLVGSPTETSELHAAIKGKSKEPPSIEVPTVDFTDVPAALAALKQFDLEVFSDSIAKTGSTIRKWQKQYKEYRDRSKGKISFRNFQKGDLALFLPTRNSIAKPWAAFNVLFPHYFLKPSGHIADQIKTREWIVARITSITERIVNHKDPASNPYGLGDGVKYYLLEVEEEIQPNGVPRRSPSAQAMRSKTTTHERVSTNIAPPESSSPFINGTPSNVSQQSLPSTSTSPPVPGPSGLSKVLAQAPVPIPPEEPSEPTHGPDLTLRRSPSPRRSPFRTPGGLSLSGSPLRPRAPSLRSSSSSRPSSVVSGARPPFATTRGTTAKAPATIALSDTAHVTTAPESENSASGPSPPETPFTSIPERLRAESLTSSVLSSPLRLNPGGVGTSASNAFATLATSWKMTLGRRKVADIQPSPEDEQTGGATDLLKRFDIDNK